MRITKKSLQPLGGACLLALLGQVAVAAEGLRAPAEDDWFSPWQARIALQSGAWQPSSGTSALNANPGSQRGVQGAAVLGDYTFARPSFGSFRASGGLLFGSQGGAPLGSVALGQRLGLSVNTLGLLSAGQPADSGQAATYLGLGFTGALREGSNLSLMADLGLVSERPAAAWGAARAMFGNTGSDYSLHDMRVSPLLQLGLRYSF